MKNIFIDTNVLIDFFADRKPFSMDAARLFNYSLKKKIKIHISAVSYNNIYYILRQTVPHKETLNMLAELNEWTNTLDVTREVINHSIKSDFKDFEDAIQYNCAISFSKMEAIVTRNTKDFKASTLPVLTPKEALVIVEN